MALQVAAEARLLEGRSVTTVIQPLRAWGLVRGHWHRPALSARVPSCVLPLSPEWAGPQGGAVLAQLAHDLQAVPFPSPPQIDFRT